MPIAIACGVAACASIQVALSLNLKFNCRISGASPPEIQK
jgi:hypothetical protein